MCRDAKDYPQWSEGDQRPSWEICIGCGRMHGVNKTVRAGDNESFCMYQTTVGPTRQMRRTDPADRACGFAPAASCHQGPMTRTRSRQLSLQPSPTGVSEENIASSDPTPKSLHRLKRCRTPVLVCYHHQHAEAQRIWVQLKHHKMQRTVLQLLCLLLCRLVQPGHAAVMVRTGRFGSSPFLRFLIPLP